jgi:opacity protein-like surface antigen
MEDMMKAILIAAATAVLLSGAAYAGDVKNESGVKTTTTKMHVQKRHRSGARADGYTTLPPKRDYGRYSNLPGKDALNSKAYIQDH